MERFKDAVPFQVLCESQSLASSGILATQPRDEGFTMHPVWFRLGGKVENCWGQRSLVGSNRDNQSRLLTRRFDDERNVNNRTGEVRSLMLIDAAFEALAVIG